MFNINIFKINYIYLFFFNIILKKLFSKNYILYKYKKYNYNIIFKIYILYLNIITIYL